MCAPAELTSESLSMHLCIWLEDFGYLGAYPIKFHFLLMIKNVPSSRWQRTTTECNQISKSHQVEGKDARGDMSHTLESSLCFFLECG